MPWPSVDAAGRTSKAQSWTELLTKPSTANSAHPLPMNGTRVPTQTVSTTHEWHSMHLPPYPALCNDWAHPLDNKDVARLLRPPPQAHLNFLDHTFLADRVTTVRQHLAAHPSIMEELPPPELVGRYSG